MAQGRRPTPASPLVARPPSERWAPGATRQARGNQRSPPTPSATRKLVETGPVPHSRKPTRTPPTALTRRSPLAIDEPRPMERTPPHQGEGELRPPPGMCGCTQGTLSSSPRFPTGEEGGPLASPSAPIGISDVGPQTGAGPGAGGAYTSGLGQLDIHSATCESREGARGVGLPPWSPARYPHPQARDPLDDTDWPKLGTAPARGKEGPHRKMRPVADPGAAAVATGEPGKSAQASGPSDSLQANRPPPKTTHGEVICAAAGAPETRAPTERGASATRLLHTSTKMRGFSEEETPDSTQFGNYSIRNPSPFDPPIHPHRQRPKHWRPLK